MGKKKKLLIGVVVFGIVIFLISLANFLSSRFFKPKFEERLTDLLDRPVEIKRLDVNFAFGRVVVEGVVIENLSGFPSPCLLKAKKVIIEGSFLPFWKRKLIILRRLVVIEPEVNIDYLIDNKINLLVLFSKEYSKGVSLGPGDKKLLKASRKGIYIKKLLIKKAKINFSDYKKGDPYITVAEKVDIGVENFTRWLWARDMETLFIIKGELGAEPAALFEMQGKLNYPLKKKINGAIELVINDINLAHLAPYYASYLHLLDVKSGRANIYARIKCDRNNLLGASKLVIKDYIVKPKDKKGSSIIRIGQGLQGETGQLELMVRLGGTIEKPTYVLSTDISEAKMRELFNRLPGLNLSGTLLESARKATSGIGKQVGSIFGRFFLGRKE